MEIDPSVPPDEQDFEFRGKSCSVKIFKTGKMVYRATGTHGHRSFTGDTANNSYQALENWKAAVKYDDPYD